jgi:hypothetical protein
MLNLIHDSLSVDLNAGLLRPDSTVDALAVDSAHDVKGNGFPCVDCCEYVNEPFDYDAARRKGERLVRSTLHRSDGSVIDVYHFDPLVLDAWVIESGNDHLEAFGGRNHFTGSVHVDNLQRGIYSLEYEDASHSGSFTG